MREKRDFRDNLERLDNAFPDKELLTQTECAKYLGVSNKTVKRRYGIGRDVTKVAFAKAIS